MKKVISVLLVVIMLLISSAVSGSALDTNYLYKDRFIEEYGYVQGSWGYNELYYHYTDDNTIDWVLVRAHIYIMAEPTDNPIYRDYVMGDIVYSTCYSYAPFETEYGIYDVAKDEFLDITKIDFEHYSDLKKVVYEEIGGRPVGDLFKDRFTQECGDHLQLSKYNELYYHYSDDTDSIDWALIYAYTEPFAEVVTHFVLGDRIILRNSLCSPFNCCYGIYDVNEDKFVDILGIDYSKYDGLQEQVESLRLGFLIGDADLDDDLSILDATHIQRVLAKLSGYIPEGIDNYNYYLSLSSQIYLISDFDRDGDVSIMDATAIQRRLAKLDVPVATPDEV